MRGFVGLGVSKVRLTGGEPTLRPDIVEIVGRIAEIPGISVVALTTNGYRFQKLARPLRDAGLKAVNISIDTLNAQRFHEVTGSRTFTRVLSGLEEAMQVGIPRVKVNAVLLRSSYAAELEEFLQFVKTKAVSVRFIELMEAADNREYFSQEHVSAKELRALLLARGWNPIVRGLTDGPAEEFSHPDFAGRIGIVAAYSAGFCDNCNRLRVSSRGKLKLCLFGEGEHSLRCYLKSPDQQQDLMQCIQEALRLKAPAHRLLERVYGSTRHLASIGG